MGLENIRYKRNMIVRVGGSVRLGQYIRSLRKRNRLRQKELADKAGLSTSYLCEIENGRTNPSLKTLMKIARALNVSCSELLNECEGTD